MTIVTNVSYYNGKEFQESATLTIANKSEIATRINGIGLVAIPAGIDPHVHFRTPGHQHKENWVSGVKAALAGGYTTVLDMPNNNPSCTTADALENKVKLIDEQLKEAGFPGFHYGLYFGADREQFPEIEKVKGQIKAIKVYMGSSTGNLLMPDEPSLRKLFTIAKQFDILVAVHAEDEGMICENEKHYSEKKFCDHSEIRNPEVALKATRLAIKLMREIKNRLYIVHVSTQGEIDLIREAKKEGYAIYAEATPHHLFLNTGHYHMHGRAKMNPPLRAPVHNQALWDALNDGTIDTIGSDHAPHTLEEKDNMLYEKCPSGVPGLETTMRLLFDSQKVSIQKIVELTSLNPRKIFNLPENTDIVLIDPKATETIEGSKLFTKCKWTPFEKWELKGVPVVTILNGEAIKVSDRPLEIEGPFRTLQ